MAAVTRTTNGVDPNRQTPGEGPVRDHLRDASTQAEIPSEAAIEPLRSVDRHHHVMPKRAAYGIELLADPTRRRIIALLAVRSLRPTTIAREVGLSRPAVSRQLKLLRENGLVERRRSFVDRRSVLYQIPPGQLRVIASWLAGTSVGRPLETEFDERGLPRLG